MLWHFLYLTLLYSASICLPTQTIFHPFHGRVQCPATGLAQIEQEMEGKLNSPFLTVSRGTRFMQCNACGCAVTPTHPPPPNICIPIRPAAPLPTGHGVGRAPPSIQTPIWLPPRKQLPGSSSFGSCSPGPCLLQLIGLRRGKAWEAFGPGESRQGAAAQSGCF